MEENKQPTEEALGEMQDKLGGKDKLQGILEDKVVQDAVKLFFTGDRLLREASKDKTVSKKGMIRSLRFALNAGITNKEIKLTNPAEKVLGSVIYEMLMSHTVMQATILNNEQEKESTEEEEKPEND